MSLAAVRREHPNDEHCFESNVAGGRGQGPGAADFPTHKLQLSILFRNRNKELIPPSATVVRDQIRVGFPQGTLRPALALPEAGPVECQPANYS